MDAKTAQMIATGRVAIYARYSTDLQHESSIEDQTRRAREAVRRAGGDPTKAIVFPDFAMSGTNMERPGLEALLRAVDEKRVDVVLTEDVSRISRDIGDAADIFKRLRFAGIPLIGLSDGIDTSAKQGKLNYTFKAMMAEWYVDEISERTLRGLEGRALAGFATGNVPFGFRTVSVADATGRIVHQIEIDETEAPIIRRIFIEYRDEGALHRIARGLNRDGVPSPRAGTKHKRYGWGASTIRAILYNEKYAGTWRFKERQWVKVPGTNKRRPRARAADEVMTIERPDLRIIDPELWSAVREKLARVKRKYKKEGNEKNASPKRGTHLLSGILVCDDCGFPLTIYGGDKRFYRCSTHHTKGLCKNDLRVREELLRAAIFDGLRAQLTSPHEMAYIRKCMAERLRDYSKGLEAEIKERRERLKRTEDRIKGLVAFIADGDKSDYVVSTLRDLEVQAKTDRAAIERIQREAQQPLRLPSLAEISGAVLNLNKSLTADPAQARARLRRWLKDGEIRVARTPEQGVFVRGGYFPLAVASENENSRQSQGFGTAESNVRSGGPIGESFYPIYQDFSGTTLPIRAPG